MIKVLIVEDSSVVRQFLTHVLSSDEQIEVIGQAVSGEDALKRVERDKPDVITIDMKMPGMDGLETTRRIMETYPTPIVIVTASWQAEEVQSTFRALEAGALAVIAKPNGIGHPNHEESARALKRIVKTMSEVKVVRRRRKTAENVALPPSAPRRSESRVDVVAIGASTGGPVTLQTILSRIPENFGAPILIVQHMAAGFQEGFIQWLSQSSRIPISIASHGDLLSAGRAYIAPDGVHLGVNSQRRFSLSRTEPENGVRPSISYLFRSVANVYGKHAAAVLLTGMGTDGSAALKYLKDMGGTAIVQDRESAVVYGMAGEALKLGTDALVLTPERIPAALEGMALRRQIQI